MGGLTNVYDPAKAATFALGFLAAASLFGRLHYATGKRRQQLKWCAYATAVLASGATVAYTVADASMFVKTQRSGARSRMLK